MITWEEQQAHLKVCITLDEDMSHLIIPMKEAKELDRFRSETLFEAITN